MTTPLSKVDAVPIPKARKYKVTFTGSLYSLGTMLRMGGQWRIISDCKCDLVLRKGADGQSSHQFQWVYVIPGDGIYPELQFIEWDLKLFEKSGDLLCNH